jgi:hypothetical protein
MLNTNAPANVTFHWICLISQAKQC